MIVSRLILKNWRNFQSADVRLGDRVFLVGPNASGKSNLLDAFRFLRDLAAKQGGGLQKAVSDRGGISKIRCLAARRSPNVEIEVHLAETVGRETVFWKYAIGIKQESRGHRNPYLAYERVWQGNEQLLLNRPDDQDRKDDLRLTQTYLEQINVNERFRKIAEFFESILYSHLVPQLLRHPEAFTGQGMPGDPFGRSFLDRVAMTPPRFRDSRLKKIEEALRIAVPQLKELRYKDERGFPHLEAIYEHWRPKGAKQREEQFSDGTLRLIALLWSLLEGDSLLLLEEPELSLNSGIISTLPGLMHRLLESKKKKRQVILSTHSADLLSDKGIGGEEVLILTPDPEGTKVEVASSIQEVENLLEAGLSVAEAALPRVVPPKIVQMELFK